MTHATRLLALLTLGLLSLPCPGEILSPDIARPQLDGLMVPLPNVGARARCWRNCTSSAHLWSANARSTARRWNATA